MLCATASRRTCLERGTDIRIIQALLRSRQVGYDSGYTRVATGHDSSSRARSTGCRSRARSPGRAGKTSRRIAAHVLPASVGGRDIFRATDQHGAKPMPAMSASANSR